MGVLLNDLVVANEDSRTLLGWEIMRSLSPEATFGSLFHEKLLPRINPLPCPRDQVQLESCFVGKEKHKLDKTSVDLPIADVVAMFGPYIKFFVAFADQAPDPVPRPPAVNGFDVMMLSVEAERDKVLKDISEGVYMTYQHACSVLYECDYWFQSQCLEFHG